MPRPRKNLRAAAQEQIANATPAQLRALVSALDARSTLASVLNQTFGGKRDLYAALGYLATLKPVDYRNRYDRGGIAKRLVEAFPQSTWRGGGEIVENDDPENQTKFEREFHELNQRLGVWSTFLKADILAGLGRFSIILLGAPGAYDAPLTRLRAEDLRYLSAKSERDVTIPQYVVDKSDARFGHPEFYAISSPVVAGYAVAGQQASGAALSQPRVHWTRVIHVAEGLLDDPVFGTPRLRAVWNYLDDLDKVVGGGSEASWKRIDGGKQFDLDGSMPMPSEADLAALREKLDAYTNGLERNLTTRGVKINDLGSNVSAFGSNADCIISLISATTGIPQRILLGSERGQLASQTDETNYDDRVADRRNEFASTQVVRPFVDRLIMLGALPKPEQYNARWPETDTLDDAGRMAMAKTAAEVNAKMGETVITRDEIRDRILGYPPMSEIEGDDELDVRVEDEDDAEEAALVAAAARSPVKRIRLLRLTPKGRRQLRRDGVAA